MNLLPIANSIVSRPKPIPPLCWFDRAAWLQFYDDLACWKADKTEAMMSGVYED